MVGRGIGLNRLTPAIVYCSPALRCVHTAAVVAKSAGCEDIRLRVEPGLFENTDLYPDGRPTLLSPQALKKAGFPVDCDYKPFVPLEQIWSKPETIADYNVRVHKTLGKVLDTIAKGASTTSALVVAHASTVDLAMGLLMRPTRRVATANDLYRIGDRVPYCACAVFEKQPTVDTWTWLELALPPVTYANFSSRLNRDFVTRT
ncbi:UBASH3A protein [Aphelenchoides avenae]|nr:UBASH3A protein [Aphelenchus avenae]